MVQGDIKSTDEWVVMISATWVCHNKNKIALPVLEYEPSVLDSTDAFQSEKKGKDFQISHVNHSSSTDVYAFKNGLVIQ